MPATLKHKPRPSSSFTWHSTSGSHTSILRSSRATDSPTSYSERASKTAMTISSSPRKRERNQPRARRPRRRRRRNRPSCVLPWKRISAPWALTGSMLSNCGGGLHPWVARYRRPGRGVRGPARRDGSSAQTTSENNNSNRSARSLRSSHKLLVSQDTSLRECRQPAGPRPPGLRRQGVFRRRPGVGS